MADKHNNKIDKISGHSVGNDQTTLTHNYWHVLLWLIHNNNNNSFRVTDLREKDVAPIIKDHIISYEF